jgi:hypothetical protein
MLVTIIFMLLLIKDLKSCLRFPEYLFITHPLPLFLEGQKEGIKGCMSFFPAKQKIKHDKSLEHSSL